MTVVLALALLVLAALAWLLAMLSTPQPDGPPQARTAPPDPIQKTVDKWMHDWMRGRA